MGDKITFDAVAYSPKGIDPILVSMIVGGVAIVGASILLFFYFKKRKPLVSEVAE